MPAKPVSAAMLLIALVSMTPPDVSAQTAQTSQSAQSDQDGDGRRRGLVWRNRPSIQIGEAIRIDLRLKLQFDGRRFDPAIEEDAFDFRVRRAGITGEVTDHFEYEIVRDLQEDGRWRDVYVNWSTFRQAEVMVGRFKVPFGREELVGITDVDFAYRTLASTTIPPAREKGVMVHGRFLRRGLTYELGVFDGDGDNGRLQEPQFAISARPPGLGRSVAARVTGTPLRPLFDVLETLHVGAAYGAVDLPEGLNSLRGESAYGTVDFFEPVYVKGRRQRIGAEVGFAPGPVGISAEWMQAREERRNQGIGDRDLSDLVTTGWYGSVTWLLTGEDKEDFGSPDRPLFRGGIGAIEIGARYEELRFESESKTGPAFTNPRAEHILGNRDAVWTFGVNWFPNRWVRLVANAIHEAFEDSLRTPEPGTSDFWSGVVRLQVVF